MVSLTSRLGPVTSGKEAGGTFCGSKIFIFCYVNCGKAHLKCTCISIVSLEIYNNYIRALLMSQDISRSKAVQCEGRL
jgi:hypothetical protein